MLQPCGGNRSQTGGVWDSLSGGRPRGRGPRPCLPARSRRPRPAHRRGPACSPPHRLRPTWAEQPACGGGLPPPRCTTRLRPGCGQLQCGRRPAGVARCRQRRPPARFGASLRSLRGPSRLAPVSEMPLASHLVHGPPACAACEQPAQLCQRARGRALQAAAAVTSSEGWRSAEPTLLAIAPLPGAVQERGRRDGTVCCALVGAGREAAAAARLPCSKASRAGSLAASRGAWRARRARMHALPRCRGRG